MAPSKRLPPTVTSNPRATMSFAKYIGTKIARRRNAGGAPPESAHHTKTATSTHGARKGAWTACAVKSTKLVVIGDINVCVCATVDSYYLRYTFEGVVS